MASNFFIQPVITSLFSGMAGHGKDHVPGRYKDYYSVDDIDNILEQAFKVAKEVLLLPAMTMKLSRPGLKTVRLPFPSLKSYTGS